MNLQEFPENIKKDIEDQSLSILEYINEDIIVIGGWGVRSHLGSNHGRYTLDIDGVANKKKLVGIKYKLQQAGLNFQEKDWGIQFFQEYNPNVSVPAEANDEVKKVELRIEISGPRISESDSDHFFEFSLTDYNEKDIPFHSTKGKVHVQVPSIEYLTANKLGLPVDYKNNFDVQMLLTLCNTDEVIKVIKSIDNWREMVVRRMPKIIGRLNNRDSLVNTLAISNGIDIRKRTELLTQIEEELKK